MASTTRPSDSTTPPQIQTRETHIRKQIVENMFSILVNKSDVLQGKVFENRWAEKRSRWLWNIAIINSDILNMVCMVDEWQLY